MQIHHRTIGSCDLFEILGDLTASTVPDLEQTLRTTIHMGRFHLVFDLSRCTYIGSSGLSLLIAYAKTCRRFDRGDVYLATVQEPVLRMMGIIGLVKEESSFFQMFDTVEEALEAASSHKPGIQKQRLS